ncbi:hypothetical protein BX616_000418 [Lobosporangium transversale]|nr:hypothetical protein BX616_000418 [Lobosporangium transversale]
MAPRFPISVLLKVSARALESLLIIHTLTGFGDAQVQMPTGKQPLKHPRSRTRLWFKTTSICAQKLVAAIHDQASKEICHTAPPSESRGMAKYRERFFRAPDDACHIMIGVAQVGADDWSTNAPAVAKKTGDLSSFQTSAFQGERSNHRNSVDVENPAERGPLKLLPRSKPFSGQGGVTTAELKGVESGVPKKTKEEVECSIQNTLEENLSLKEVIELLSSAKELAASHRPPFVDTVGDIFKRLLSERVLPPEDFCKPYEIPSGTESDVPMHIGGQDNCLKQLVFSHARWGVTISFINLSLSEAMLAKTPQMGIFIGVVDSSISNWELIPSSESTSSSLAFMRLIISYKGRWPCRWPHNPDHSISGVAVGGVVLALSAVDVGAVRVYSNLSPAHASSLTACEFSTSSTSSPGASSPARFTAFYIGCGICTFSA